MSSSQGVIRLDIAIIGGGSAGMALATKLNRHAVAVFEPKTADERECSWALWQKQRALAPLKHAIKGQWAKWALVDDQGEVVHQGGSYRYVGLSSAAHLKYCEEQLLKNTVLVRAPVKELTRIGMGGNFIADGKRYSANYIYDSRPPVLADGGLCQHFVGWEITTEQPIMQSDTAILMDFRVDQSRGLHFIYALPYSNHHMLVESTMISLRQEEKDWYRSAIQQWLEQRNIKISSVLREECGVIPMTPVGERGADRSAIGAASGAVRLSSGYGFSSIQSQMTELARSISADEYIVPEPFSKRITFMDKVFNRALMAEPTLRVRLFMATAKALNGEQFARFMLGSASVKEWLKVIWAMPKWLFVSSAVKQVLRYD